jgi:3-oxocholest-4-en-26-oate---CoA ligase
MSTPPEIHVADLYEALSDATPEAPAIVQGSRTVTWRQFDDRSARLAAFLASQGIGNGHQVGMYLYNCAEYLETQYAAFKNRFCAVNVNYRYLDDELVYLLDNADCRALVFHGGLAERVARIKDRLPLLTVLVQVDDPLAPEASLVEGAVRYEDCLLAYEPAPRIPRELSDLYMLYTGGTTGMPKGVMSPVGVVAPVFLTPSSQNLGREPFTSIDDVVTTVKGLASLGIQMKGMPCCPLMHGTGIWLGAFTTHLLGGCVVLLEGRGFDPVELFDAIDQHGVNVLVIVGDAFARPMLRTLQESQASAVEGEAARWKLSSVLAIISSGAMFSQEVKTGVLEYIPQARIVDTLGSSEGAMGSAVSTKDGASTTAKFDLFDNVKVIDEDGNPVVPGSGVMGRVASPAFAMGYYKDPEKTARTFVMIDGQSYSLPGDMALVEADGSLTLLGRGSNCINTAGEKVFPEEVEEAVKRHPAVADCLVFGLEDDRFGQRVVGVASLSSNSEVPGETIIVATKELLASYKVPRHLVIVPEVPRAPNGKADYVQARELFALALASKD